MLFLKTGQCQEKAGFTEVDFIRFAIMTGTISPLGTECSDLGAVTFNG